MKGGPKGLPFFIGTLINIRMASVLDSLVDKQGDSVKSAAWYQANVRKIAGRATARQLMSSGKLNSRPSTGRLNMFFYDSYNFIFGLSPYNSFTMYAVFVEIEGWNRSYSSTYLNS